MKYEINWQQAGFMFALPQSIAAKLNRFDEAPLKVAVFVFANREYVEIEDIAASLNLQKAQVEAALLTLEKEGILSISQVVEKNVAPSNPLTLQKAEFAKIVNEDEAVAFLLAQAQLVLGRTLNYAESNSLVSLHCFYGLEVDVVLMLLTYCMKLKKTSINYIQKVGIDWANKGITNHIAAEEYIKAQEVQNEHESIVKQLFGIHGRTLSKRERDYGTKWLAELQMSYELISEAYEICVANIGKINFTYINNILLSWHKKGYTTLSQVAQEKQLQRDEERTSYDLQSLEALMDHSAID